MAFWGVEVRPGKPYTHRYDASHGRLRIAQATLGTYKSTVRSVLQCNVGENSPVLICSLLPKVMDSFHVEIELEEETDVIFSVLGETSIYLSGYYMSSRARNSGDETDSYGEDIGEDDSEGSIHDSDEKYESDFIDDGDTKASCQSSDETHDDSKETGLVKDTSIASGRRRLRKKNWVHYSDDEIEDVSEYQPTVKSDVAVNSSPNELDKSNTRSKRLKRKHGQDDSTEEINGALEDKDLRKSSHDFDAQNMQRFDNVSGSPGTSPQHGSKRRKKKSKNVEKALKNDDGSTDSHTKDKKKTASDIVVDDIVIGSSDTEVATDGSKVYVNYVGKLPNGEIIASNLGKKPYKFRLGSESVSKGWNMGITGMHVGGKRRLKIPPSLWSDNHGIELKGVQKVPENLWVEFELELLKVR